MDEVPKQMEEEFDANPIAILSGIRRKGQFCSDDLEGISKRPESSSTMQRIGKEFESRRYHAGVCRG
ncbi:hypothetical protein Q3G72_025922 [Acer saccharum]|nr:hypothetical protein Q3G72_025922 [Acer saccharum]